MCWLDHFAWLREPENASQAIDECHFVPRLTGDPVMDGPPNVTERNACELVEVNVLWKRHTYSGAPRQNLFSYCPHIVLTYRVTGGNKVIRLPAARKRSASISRFRDAPARISE